MTVQLMVNSITFADVMYIWTTNDSSAIFSGSSLRNFFDSVDNQNSEEWGKLELQDDGHRTMEQFGYYQNWIGLPLTMMYILLECRMLEDIRRKYFKVFYLRNFFESVFNQNSKVWNHLILTFWDRRRGSGEGKGVEGKYIPWGNW